MKIRFYTKFGNVKCQRIIECDSVDFVANELHYVHGAWRSPLAYYLNGAWFPAVIPSEIPSRSEHIEIVEL